MSSNPTSDCDTTYPWRQRPAPRWADVIVENQIAMGDPPTAREALARLMGERLDRHDALHAVGSVIMGIVFEAVREKGKDAGDIIARYSRELAALTAAGWRAQR